MMPARNDQFQNTYEIMQTYLRNGLESTPSNQPPERIRKIRRKIRLMEANAECLHLKKLVRKGTLWQVFIRFYRLEITNILGTSSVGIFNPSLWSVLSPVVWAVLDTQINWSEFKTLFSFPTLLTVFFSSSVSYKIYAYLRPTQLYF